jgi:Acetyltransferases, including N-acetylases of ribosomal proteins
MSHTPKPPEMIEGDKVILRRKRTEHAEETFKLIDKNRAHLRPWMPWEEANVSVSDAKGYIELTKKWWDTGSTFDFTMIEKSSGKIAGSFGLHSIDWFARKVEVGYWIGEEFQGKGLVSDALRLGEKMACDLSFHRVGLTCDPKNKKSIAVAVRNGYTHEATHRDDSQIRGELRDTRVYVKFFNPKVEGEYNYNLPEGFTIKEIENKDEFWKIIDENINKVFGDEDINIFPTYYSAEEKEKLKNLFIQFPYHMRLLVLYKGQVAGWAWGYQDDHDSYYMQNSGVLPEYRSKGLYTAMLDYVMEKCITKGYQKIWSRHNCTNSAILIPKLKWGFQITGTELSDKFGAMVILSYFPNKTRRKVIEFRAGARPDEEIRKLAKL